MIVVAYRTQCRFSFSTSCNVSNWQHGKFQINRNYCFTHILCNSLITDWCPRFDNNSARQNDYKNNYLCASYGRFDGKLKAKYSSGEENNGFFSKQDKKPLVHFTTWFLTVLHVFVFQTNVFHQVLSAVSKSVIQPHIFTDIMTSWSCLNTLLQFLFLLTTKFYLSYFFRVFFLDIFFSCFHH